MNKYDYNLTFNEVCYLLELLSKKTDTESCNIKRSLTSQLARWERWDADLKKISESGNDNIFTGI